MNSPTDDHRLIEFGKQVRARRKTLRMSIRQLASECGISASYVSAIESGRNPATGRPPEPSIGIVERLCSVLTISWDAFGKTSSICCEGCDHDHVLLYRLDDAKADLRQTLDTAFGASIKQWVCISDPRQVQHSDENMLSWHWPFGSHPYPDNFLVADRISDALEEKVTEVGEQITHHEYGVVIADCSAVMRWMVNPEAEIDYEGRWIAQSMEIFERIIGRAPKTNVCMYSHNDLEALSNQIDVLGTILRLFSAHNRTVTVASDGTVLSGSKAISTVLENSRPGGVSSSAWQGLCDAASTSYATRSNAA